MSLLEKLNDKQREAAATVEGPLLIFGGSRFRENKNHNLSNCSYDRRTWNPTVSYFGSDFYK